MSAHLTCRPGMNIAAECGSPTHKHTRDHLPNVLVCLLSSTDILAEIVPRMLTRGLTKRDVQRLLIDNPRAVLTFAKPQQLLPAKDGGKKCNSLKRIAPAPKL
eukprot:COSAG02_NODE_396_length_23126_cov_282.150258_15_plen_103_part_00